MSNSIFSVLHVHTDQPIEPAPWVFCFVCKASKMLMYFPDSLETSESHLDLGLIKFEGGEGGEEQK